MTAPQNPQQPPVPFSTPDQQTAYYPQQPPVPQPGTEYPTGYQQAPATGQFSPPPAAQFTPPQPAPQQQYADPAAVSGVPAGGAPQPGANAIVNALLDFNFRLLAGPSLLQITYVVALVFLGLTYLFAVLSGFASGTPLLGVAALILGAPGVVLSVLLVRMFLELVSVVYRAGEDVRALRDHQGI